MKYQILVKENIVMIGNRAVEKDGSITDIKILRDAGSGLGEEAIRVVREMPKWKPAKQRTKVVRQQFTLPVKFKLNK